MKAKSSKVKEKGNPVRVKNTGRVRERQLAAIPAFNSHVNQAPIKYANIDRVKIGIKHAFTLRFENEDELEIFLSRLGNQSTSRVFYNDGGKRRFKTRSKSINGNTRWLFNAEINIFKNTKSPTSRLEYVASLNLDLNLTKFLNHLVSSLGYVNFPRLLARLDNLSPEDVLEGSLHLADKDFGLDGNSNVLPAEVYRHMRPQGMLFDKYLGKVLTLIELELRSAITLSSRRRGTNGIETELKNWHMPHLEIYWEYATSNALAFVKTFHEKYMPKFDEAELAYYRLKNDVVEKMGDRAGDFKVRRNAPSSTLKLGSNLDLVTYAKHLERVRFEIKFKKNVREHLRISSDRMPETAYQASKLIAAAIPYSQKKLDKLFTRIPLIAPSLDHEFAILLDLVYALDLSAQEEGISGQLRELISKLAVNRSITVKRNGSEDKFCGRLLKRRILNKPALVRNIDGTIKYNLSTKYAGILWKLQGMKI